VQRRYVSYIVNLVYEFRWNDWNIEHIADHGVGVDEAEFVVNHARPPYPEKIRDGKWRVWGRTSRGTYLQVIYIFSPNDVVFVIHAMPLTETQKRQYRRRIR
jgi:uncharacterized DUF497 family protein